MIEKKLVKFIVPVFIIALLFTFFGTSCKNKKKQEEAFKRYQALAIRLGKLQKKSENLNLENIYDDYTGFLKIAEKCDNLLKDVYEDAKKAEILSLKAKALGLAHKVRDSQKIFEEALKLDPGNYKIYQRYGDMYYANREYKKAARQFNIALIHIPPSKVEDKVEIMFYLGDILEQHRDFTRAEQYYEKLIRFAEDYGVESEYYEEARARLTELQKE